MYNPDKCSSFEMMFGFPAPPPPKKKRKQKKKKNE
tara:strand:- start:497 stop:601 length:105 start_codon:yes stop_codon:yes gene_type:complete